MHPYSENPIRHTLGRTRNWRDSLNIFEDSHGPEGKYNPVFKLDFLGGVLSQGLVGYITMVSVSEIVSTFPLATQCLFDQGVNASANYDNFWKG
jgi:hypothetical protein